MRARCRTSASRASADELGPALAYLGIDSAHAHDVLERWGTSPRRKRS